MIIIPIQFLRKILNIYETLQIYTKYYLIYLRGRGMGLGTEVNILGFKTK